ncbi:MAG: MaoC family dehydratase N-terminal domain-containing protein [Planctomycetaceae bacterium]|nr:MaoC family dehydratase N-terminal domain-containing protein [Planctomycetaceae bacterium]
MNFEDVVVGERYELPPVTIEREKVLAFAREYDPLPFHLDDEYAKTTRYGALIAPGVMSFMAVWSNYARMNLYGTNLIGGASTKIEWLSPVYVGDVLRGVVTVTAKRRRNPHNGVMDLTTEVFNQDGVLVIRDVTEQIVAG